MHHARAATLVLVAATACSLGPPLCLRTTRGRALPRMAFAVGAEFQFAAGQRDILDECDRESPPGVRWASSAPAVASVDAQGRVRALAPGRTEVIARAGGAEARFGITVVPPVARIRLLPADTTFTVGDTVVFRAVALGRDGRPVPQALVALHVAEHPPSRQAGAPRALREVHSFGRAATPATRATPNTVGVHADRAAAGYVVGTIVGRVDSVLVRAVAP